MADLEEIATTNQLMEETKIIIKNSDRGFLFQMEQGELIENIGRQLALLGEHPHDYIRPILEQYGTHIYEQVNKYCATGVIPGLEL